MSRKCTICEHPDRKRIDKSLVEPNASIRAISIKWHVSRAALSRHVNNGHIIAKIEKSAIAKEAVDADGFVSHLQLKKKRFAEMAAAARNEGDTHLELKVYQVESKFAEMEGKALGAFREKVEHSGPAGRPLFEQYTPQQIEDEVKRRVAGQGTH